jgi:hypothetical protein
LVNISRESEKGATNSYGSCSTEFVFGVKHNKEETPSSNGVVWAYFLCCWASKSNYLFFVDLGKKTVIDWAPPVSPSWPAATIIFLGNFFKSNNYLFIIYFNASTTPCPVFLSGNNWILNWSHYQLLPMLPTKKFFWNICVLL